VEKVFLLQNLPTLFAAVVLAHELGHCLICKEGISLPKKEEEGLCELLAFIWINEMEFELTNQKDLEENNLKRTKYSEFVRQFTSKDLKSQIKRIVENKSLIYGNGFREALESLIRGWSLTNMVKFATKYGRFPTIDFSRYVQIAEASLSQNEDEEILNDYFIVVISFSKKIFSCFYNFYLVLGVEKKNQQDCDYYKFY